MLEVIEVATGPPLEEGRQMVADSEGLDWEEEDEEDNIGEDATEEI